MARQGKPLWSVARQLVGNLLPLALGAPFAFFAFQSFQRDGLQGWALGWLAGWVGVTWMATNLLATLGSRGLHRQMELRFRAERPGDTVERHFVGFARPGYAGLLDPHEDVGLLLVYPDRLEFYGSALEVTVNRSDVRAVRYRLNIHTLAGLGRWVSVDAETGGKRARLLVEPRERPTLLGNLMLGALLLKRLQDWAGKGQVGAPSRGAP